MEKQRISWPRVLGGGVLLAVFHFPLVALYPILEEWLGVLAFPLLLVVSGVLSFFALWDESGQTVLWKWLVSVPLSLLFSGLPTEITTRWINLRDPGYGRLSAGGGFAIMVTFLCGGAVWLFVLLAALTSPSSGGERAQKARQVVQRVVLPVLALGVFLALVYIDAVTPSMTTIYQQAYG